MLGLKIVLNYCFYYMIKVIKNFQHAYNHLNATICTCMCSCDKSLHLENQESHGRTTLQDKPKCVVCWVSIGPRITNRLLDFILANRAIRQLSASKMFRSPNQFRDPRLLGHSQVKLLPYRLLFLRSKQLKHLLLSNKMVGRPCTQGDSYVFTQQDTQASNTMVLGIQLITAIYAYVLFDYGVTHFFVSSNIHAKA